MYGRARVVGIMTALSPYRRTITLRGVERYVHALQAGSLVYVTSEAGKGL